MGWSVAGAGAVWRRLRGEAPWTLRMDAEAAGQKRQAADKEGARQGD